MTGSPTALEAARCIADGSPTSEQEPVVQAWQHLDMDAVLKMARHLNRFGSGPLRGIPIWVKDIIDTANMPTGCGSSLYETFRPPRDATCVALARHAGALILGKTVTREFAYFWPGKTRNRTIRIGHPAAPPRARQLQWPVGDVTLTRNTVLYSSRKNPASREKLATWAGQNSASAAVGVTILS